LEEKSTMKHSDARYVATGVPAHLELHCEIGTYRGVVFVDDSAAADDRTARRAELDCLAVTHGFLPRGASLVSSPGVTEAAIDDEGQVLERARFVVAAAGHITQAMDDATRRRLPAAAELYDALSMPETRTST
jgi:hypothetical protein